MDWNKLFHFLAPFEVLYHQMIKIFMGLFLQVFKHIAAVILKRQMNVRQFFLLSPLTF